MWRDVNFIYTSGIGNAGLTSFLVDGSGNLTHIDTNILGGEDTYSVWGDGNFIYTGATQSSLGFIGSYKLI